ncbi:MAG TPA: 3-dehydroquinate synthase [Thermomicrobiales bacterium]|nr:3-dehydroquinate synthase [Thermomicrobiales bacterium]
MIARLVLVGFSGTGKSSVGRVAADRLGWTLVDMDDAIERREGVSIPELFAGRGEPAFRQIERDVFVEALGRERVVIATGGGAVANDAIWPVLLDDPATLTVALDAAPETILARLQAQISTDGETTRRPLLDSPDPLARIRELRDARAGYYARAQVTIPVDGRAPERTAADLAELVALAAGTPSEVALEVPNARSRILVGQGTRERLMEEIAARWPKARRLWLAADAGMRAANGPWVDGVSGRFSGQVNITNVPSGETSKSLAGLGALYDWMIPGGVERGDVAIAAGGGVTGDLMGFAAATVLRGIGLAQVPTTLLSMVDSSVGGKTGINHPGGKNLIGAFYQPSLVLVDPAFLRTLPPRELRSGWAEVIKHGMIQASTPGGENGFLRAVLERNAPALTALAEPVTSWVIRQNIALKAAVVAEDEREARLRAILNFGHTIGHGVEAAGYALLHGEAVAVGLVAAMTIGVEKGMIDDADRERLVRQLAAYGLPTVADVDIPTVREKMARDKKKASGAQQWILPRREGGVEIRTDVTEAEIAHALETVTGSLARS